MTSAGPFISLFFRFSLRNLRRHPWRFAAVLFGIALGAAVFTSIRLAVDASLASFENSMALLAGEADLAVTRPGGEVPEDLVAKLLAQPFVAAAAPVISRYVESPGRPAEPFLLLGLDPIQDGALRRWRPGWAGGAEDLPWLDLMQKPGTLVLARPLARLLGLGPGERRLRLEHLSQTASFEVLGVLAPEGLALVDGGLVALADIATVQEFIRGQGWVDRIDLKLAPGASAEQVLALKHLLPPGLVLEPPAELGPSGNTMLRAYRLNLSLLSFIALFVGSFLVYSLVSINAASRRRELAVLRALGGSARLVFFLVLSEGLLFGLLGWLLAIPIGAMLVRYMVEAVSGTISHLFVRVSVEALSVSAWEIGLSLAVTLLVCLAAAYEPARASTKVSPREAMFLDDPPSLKAGPGNRAALAGLLLIFLSWPMSRVTWPRGVPSGGYAAALAMVLGFALLGPWLLRGLGTRLPPLLRHAAGEPAFLGGRFMRDAGKRASVAVGALITAMALFVALAIMVHSFRQTVTLWIHQTLAGDLFVRARMAGYNQFRDSLPESVVSRLGRLSGDFDLAPSRVLFLRYGGTPYQLEAIDAGLLLKYGRFLLTQGRPEEVLARLKAGQGVLVSEVFANQTGLGLGKMFRVRLGDKVIEMPVAGVHRDYRTQGGIVYMDLAAFQRLTGDERWSGVRFFMKDRGGGLEAGVRRLRARILACCGQEFALEMVSGASLRREILTIFDETFAITIVLLAISLLVAGLGITTTLTVLVLERIRLLNTMVAVGASAWQIRFMIFWEAVLMVLTGEVLGLACGFFLSYLLIFVINRVSFGWTFLYRLDVGALALSLPLILATALIAALPATWIALKSPPALVLKET